HAHEQHRQGCAPAARFSGIIRDPINGYGPVTGRMLRLGLTGGIASGKSAVAAMLRELGFSVLDADSLAHKLIEPGQPAYEEVLREFGRTITDDQGRVTAPSWPRWFSKIARSLIGSTPSCIRASRNWSSASSMNGSATALATPRLSKPRCSS